MVCRNYTMASVLDISNGKQILPIEKRGNAIGRRAVGSLEEEKTLGLRKLSQAVAGHLIQKVGLEPEIINVINIVMKKSPQKEGVFDYRIFDTAEAEALNFQVKDYAALDIHPELILFEGWIKEDSFHIEMWEKRGTMVHIPLLTKQEIQKSIEALEEPGSSVYFYQARGSAYGGPLGGGALIVELNPAYKEKKVSKYIIYKSNMVGKRLVGESRKLWRSNSAEKTAELIMVGHHKRICS